MAEQDESGVAADGNTDTMPAQKTADRNNKQGNSGCLVLFLLAMPILNVFGMVISLAGPYGFIVLTIGLAGFACGALVVILLSARFTQRPWWKSCWWAVGGLVGLCLPGIIALLSFYARAPARFPMP